MLWPIWGCRHSSYCPPAWGKQTTALFHRLISIPAITPLDWSYRHRLHHSHSGNYDSKAYGWNDTVFFTVKSFDKLGPVVRSPLAPPPAPPRTRQLARC